MDAKQFLAEFGHIANSPDGLQKIRGLILTLAMQGKIVNQDTNEPDAEELLIEIKIIKEELISKKVIRSTKTLDIEKSEILHTIPDKWRWVRFGDIARHNAGKTLDKGRNKGQLRDYITTSNLYWGKFILDDVRQMPIRDEELDKCTAIKGDLLICEGGEAGRAAVWDYDKEVCFQNHIHRARFYYGIDPYYAYRFFEKLNSTGEINNYRKGVAISNMSGKALSSILFPLPPLEEQKRIVSRIDELMALCDKLEAQQQKRHKLQTLTRTTALDALASAQSPHELKHTWLRFHRNMQFLLQEQDDISHLIDMTYQLAVSGKTVRVQESRTEPVENMIKLRQQSYEQDCKEIVENGGRAPKLPPLRIVESQNCPNSWHAMTLESACTFIIDCPHSTPKFSEVGYYCIDTNSIKPRDIQWSIARKVKEDSYLDRIKRLKPKKGDVLFSREGTIGIAALVREEFQLCLGQRMMMFRFSPFVLPEYAEIFILSGFFKSEYEPFIKGTAAKHLNIGDLRKLTIFVPPIDVQVQIVEFANWMTKKCFELEKQLVEAKKLLSNYAKYSIASIAGAKSEEIKIMKIPKTELKSNLKLKVSPTNKDQAPLSAILAKHNGELSSKALWNYSGLEIDAFYRQLRTEMARDWIVEPQKARVIEKDAEKPNEAEAG